MRFQTVMIIAIIFTCLLAVSGVSAADNATDDVVSVENEINNDFSFESDVDSEKLKTSDLEEKNIEQIDYSKDYENILVEGNESDKISAKIIPLNLEAEYASGIFTFKLVDIDTNEPLSNKKLTYTILTGGINTGGFLTTDAMGVAYLDNSRLNIYDFINDDIVSKGHLKVGNQLFSIKCNDSSVFAPEITGNFTITQTTINIKINPYKEYFGSNKKVVINVTNAKTGAPMGGIVLHLYMENTAIENDAGDFYLITGTNGTVEINVSNLNAGKYSLSISNDDTENIKLKSVSGTVTILPTAYADDKEKIEIIAQDIDLYYSTSYSYFVSLVDEYGDPVYDVDELKVVYDDGEEEIGYCDDDGDYLFSQETIGNRNAILTLTDSYYWAYPVTINVKISKSPVKITAKAYYSNTKQYSILKAIVKDNDGEPIEEGKVKFDINGKAYYASVKDGVATKKIKLTKPKTYTYSATYIENDHYKDSKVSSSKIYVYSSSKNARTFNINGYKITLTQNQYNKLINAKNTNKMVYFEVKTNKYVTQTYQTCKITEKWVLYKKNTYPYGYYFNKNKYKVKNYRKIWIDDGAYDLIADIYKKVSTKNIITKTVKARVSILISYGGKTGGQLASANKYCMILNTPYQNPGYDTCKPWLYGTKSSTDLNKLNSAKVKKHINY